MRPQELSQFEVFADLDEHSCLVAAKVLQLKHHHKGDVLFEVGDDDDIEHFLLEGQVNLLAQDGRNKVIEAGDGASRFPLALLRPRKFKAEISSDKAEVLCIDIEVLQLLRQNVPEAGDGAAAYTAPSLIQSLSRSAQSKDTLKTFLQGARHAVLDNRLAVGNFSEVSNTIYKAVNAPDVCLDTLVAAAQLDAAISAKLIKAANSAFFMGQSKVDSVRAALVRLGLELGKELMLVMVMKEVFSSKLEGLETAMHQLWQSSIKLATYTVVIAKRSKLKFSQGQCLLAGLVADLGNLVTIAYLDQFPGVKEQMTLSLLSSKVLKHQLGRILLTHWQFPQNLIDVAEYSDEWEREAEQIEIIDIVCLAKLLLRLSSYRKLPFESLTDVPSFRKLGLNGSPEAFIHDVRDEASRYLELFNGAFD
jgi:HD-like signal output (HDOD) protein